MVWRGSGAVKPETARGAEGAAGAPERAGKRTETSVGPPLAARIRTPDHHLARAGARTWKRLAEIDQPVAQRPIVETVRPTSERISWMALARPCVT